MKNKYIIGIFGILVIVVLVGFAFSRGEESIEKNIEIENTKDIENLLSKVNDEGMVTVTVTPIDLQNLSFEVVLSTHTVDISEDLLESVVLIDDNGEMYEPSIWEGDPPGGHHREGILQFDTITPQPKEVVLLFRGVGGIDERRFVWGIE